MITYQNAKQLAKQVIPDINIYYDYPDAFIFSNSHVKESECDDNEVVVEKSTGKLIDYSIYIMKTKYADMEVQGQQVI